jgi:L-threonylcarbamoyladenylate synthase
MPPLTSRDVDAFERCLRQGGVAVFPADTVYGLACAPDSTEAIERMYALKGRPSERPSALMFFQLESALAALPRLGRLTQEAVGRLLPGPVTVILPNPGGVFPLATREGTLGVRVPGFEGAIAPLAGAGVTALQTSANLSGASDARRLEEVPESIRRQADLVIDGGVLSGKPSTVVDLTRYEETGRWRILREAAISGERVSELIATET